MDGKSVQITVQEELIVKEEFRMICDYMENCMRDMAHDREHVWRVLTAAVDIARHVDEKPDFRILTRLPAARCRTAGGKHRPHA